MHYNGLTSAEAERLAILAEECAEVIQAIGKILRHGYENYHPDGGPTNRKRLETELGHVSAATMMMRANADVDKRRILAYCKEKRSRIGKYSHHQILPMGGERRYGNDYERDDNDD